MSEENRQDIVEEVVEEVTVVETNGEATETNNKTNDIKVGDRKSVV